MSLGVEGRLQTPATRIRVVGVLSLVLLLLWPTLGLAYTRDRSRSGAHRRWDRQLLSYRVVPSKAVPELADATRRALEIWRAPCAQLGFREAGAAEVPDLLIQVAAAEDWRQPPTQGAFTALDDGPRGHLRRGIVSLNGAHAFGDPEEDPSRLDLVGILAHELGHALGVGHSLQRGALMAPGVRPGARLPRTLTPDDRAVFCLVYPKGPRDSRNP